MPSIEVGSLGLGETVVGLKANGAVLVCRELLGGLA